MTRRMGNTAPRGNLWRIAMWGAAAFLLLLPLVAMQFTSEVDWDEADFITIGIMLLVACVACELGARVARSSAYLAAVGVAVATSFVLVWMNLAVGIIGSEDNPANVVFGGVLAIGIAGAYVARARPEGMARALVATATAHALVGVFGAIVGSVEALVLTVFFDALWLTSAALFRKAAREQSVAAAAH